MLMSTQITKLTFQTGILLRNYKVMISVIQSLGVQSINIMSKSGRLQQFTVSVSFCLSTLGKLTYMDTCNILLHKVHYLIRTSFTVTIYIYIYTHILIPPSLRKLSKGLPCAATVIPFVLFRDALRTMDKFS